MWGCETAQWTRVALTGKERFRLDKAAQLDQCPRQRGLHIWAAVSLCPANLSFTGQRQAVLSMALLIDSNTRVKGCLGSSQQFCTRSGLASHLIQTLEAFIGLELSTGHQPGTLISDLGVTRCSEVQPLPDYRVFYLPWLLILRLSMHFCRP